MPLPRSSTHLPSRHTCPNLKITSRLTRPTTQSAGGASAQHARPLPPRPPAPPLGAYSSALPCIRDPGYRLQGPGVRASACGVPASLVPVQRLSPSWHMAHAPRTHTLQDAAV